MQLDWLLHLDIDEVIVQAPRTKCHLQPSRVIVVVHCCMRTLALFETFFFIFFT